MKDFVYNLIVVFAMFFLLFSDKLIANLYVELALSALAVALTVYSLYKMEFNTERNRKIAISASVIGFIIKLYMSFK